ncbi:triose-phosphate isomerase [Biformimicrobium ophioploci]|uniref:Triosephosphate isomerase n=1 Tax=Biformimicrobium ophioploci TaxID=3036711 RepID=A0ABQ6LWE2_9GAMM|nr:triose-phosphate isomerase [Microbulbifer sp. NKW57]GMG86389.1 triose-phosphate isomerase [Microbulbifer sp. NKW57]
MRQKLVVANWKMHGSSAFIRGFFAEFAPAGNVVICPPYPYLATVAAACAEKGLEAGAQNLNAEPQGAFTGEVSAAMLGDLGVRYVIVGHSERRSLYGESNTVVAEKYHAARAAGLVPILCVGETLEQRESGNTLQVIAEQLAAVSGEAESPWDNAVIAYEPVWAIGTGKTATPEQAQEVHAFIRQALGAEGQSIQVLYGGSVKGDNAAELFAQADIDGALVGGASLKPEEFAKICSAAV